jgi:serine protease Do
MNEFNNEGQFSNTEPESSGNGQNINGNSNDAGFFAPENFYQNSTQRNVNEAPNIPLNENAENVVSQEPLSAVPAGTALPQEAPAAAPADNAAANMPENNIPAVNPQTGVPPIAPPPQNFEWAQGMPPRPPKKKNHGVLTASILVAVMVLGLVCTFILTLNTEGNAPESESSYADSSRNDSLPEITTHDKPQSSDVQADENGKYSTQEVAKLLLPSVVGVVVYGAEQSFTPIGQGSGIIISEDGYVVTNAHVLENAAAQKVVLYNEKEYVANVVGIDSKTDLAVLKIEPDEELTPAVLGNSDELELGEQVITLGNPGGLANSFSGGYVSGLNRQIKTSEYGLAMNSIQTDAAVNPGNSGGPLVNMYGQVVGIVSSKYVAEDYEGIGFAIAINDALPIIQDIISQGYVSGRVRIGIYFEGITEETARMYGIKPGLYIKQIDPSCDIANSGLQVYDIITEINGKKVYDYETAMESIEGFKAGDEITAKVYRKSIVGDETEFEIKFKLMEDTSGN